MSRRVLLILLIFIKPALQDLTVTVTEADGSKHVSTQAYSTLPVMLRAGALRYEVNVGRYSNGGYTNGAEAPMFGAATLVYGLPHYVTLYGGSLVSEHYMTAALGSGLSLGYWGLYRQILQLRGQL